MRDTQRGGSERMSEGEKKKGEDEFSSDGVRRKSMSERNLRLNNLT